MKPTHPLALLALLTPLPILATPNVTPIPLSIYPGTCTSWPRWIPTRDSDTTGTLMFTVTQADDDGINDLMAAPISIPWGSSTRNMLSIDLRKSRAVASKSPLRCNNGQAVIGSNTFQTITVDKDINNAHMLVQPAVEGYRLDVYAHEIDGVRQDGVFLGSMNRTTWGFYYVDGLAGGSCMRDYYGVKLLDLPEDPNTQPVAGSPVQFKGFIKVVDW